MIHTTVKHNDNNTNTNLEKHVHTSDDDDDKQQQNNSKIIYIEPKHVLKVSAEILLDFS